MPVREIEKYCPYRQCIVPRGLGDSGARFCRDLISNTSKSPPISFLALFELCEALSYPGTCFTAGKCQHQAKDPLRGTVGWLLTCPAY
jgi:hypothetical protein